MNKGIRLRDPLLIPQHQLANNMETVPLYGIEDILNFLIVKSSDYDRQKVASYKAFEEYGLFVDGHVEDLKMKEISGHLFLLLTFAP